MKNVYNIIEESPFYFELGDYDFYFSSEFNLKRFKDKYKEYIKEENRKLNNRYKFNINLEVPLLFSFYKKIESRGFRVFDKKLNLLLIDNIKFSTIIL